MNVSLKEMEQYKIFEAVAGSHAYGLNHAKSDVDLRGVFVLPHSFHLGLESPPQEVSDDKQDIKFYELKRYFELASGCNPNIIELLYMPTDCVNVCSPLMAKLILNRDLFLSQKAFYTFSGYAHAQIKRAKGQNKWINNPQPKDRPNPMSYMYHIDDTTLRYKRLNTEIEYFPCRPKLLDSLEYGDTPTEGIKVARVEHGFNCFRMYADDKADFFKNCKIECSSISKEDERLSFIGLVSFNEVQYKADVLNWKNYWEWKKNRNEARWEAQESGEMDYDCKNMMHCFRMILSTRSILVDHKPMVRFEGEDQKFLMSIREGKYEYDYLMERLERELKELDGLKAKCTLPEKVNMKKIHALYMEMINE